MNEMEDLFLPLPHCLCGGAYTALPKLKQRTSIVNTPCCPAQPLLTLLTPLPIHAAWLRRRRLPSSRRLVLIPFCSSNGLVAREKWFGRAPHPAAPLPSPPHTTLPRLAVRLNGKTARRRALSTRTNLSLHHGIALGMLPMRDRSGH